MKYKKDYIVLSNEYHKIKKIFMDHCKPLLSPIGEVYRWQPAEYGYKKTPGIRGFFFKKKVSYKSGYRDSEFNYIEPLIDERFMVIDGVVYNAYCAQVTYSIADDPKDGYIGYYFYTDEEVEEFFNMLIEKGYITENDIIIKNTTRKKYL